MDTCKGFGDSAPTCAPTEFCMSTIGIMDGGEFHDLNMNLYTCDNEMMNQMAWPFKGNNAHLHNFLKIFGDIILIFQGRHGHQTFVSKWEVDVTT